MSFAKWIGGALGWSFGGPIGAIIGLAIGSFVDNLTENGTPLIGERQTGRQRDPYHQKTTQKRYQRPQAVLWSNNAGTLVNGLYVPNGYEVGEDVPEETAFLFFFMFFFNNKLFL